MKQKILKYFLPLVLIFLWSCQPSVKESAKTQFTPTDAEALPMVYWYWNDAAVSKEGITHDLEAMKQAGLEGAYIFFIRGKSNRVKFDAPAEQLTPEWWQLVKFAFSEAKRLGLKLGLHSCDGFTCAGGPWITSELSMQKVVWSDTIIHGGETFSAKLPQPETVKDYYEDIKVFAYPVTNKNELSSNNLNPRITSNTTDKNPVYLNAPETRKRFRSKKPCWIQYAFDEPFTCRSIVIKKAGNIFQSERLIIEISNNGKDFKYYTRLKPHRQGWMDDKADMTFAIKPVTAKYFRFVYDKEGTEPAAEDLDAAKWNPALKIAGIKLCSSAKIHEYEGKSGYVWRIADATNNDMIKDTDCIAADKIMDISSYLDTTGRLNWNVPKGTWKILRMGHTTTGTTNYIGGGGKGLECDKLNPKTVKFQFDKWIGEFYRQIGADNAADVLKYFHVDSWECGSQNWSSVFAEEFKKRRGYNILQYLPVFAGVPIKSTDFSEKVLHDVRTTISELITDNFYGTFEKLAHQKGMFFSAESTAPVAVADGMLHQKNVDIPMGEFWLNSPTHDKPNDVLDAVSAAHIYGKPIVQTESFTEIRIDWNEHPGMLKTLGDRNFALGVNRFVFHVFCQNPWVDRKPGMTLGVVGLVFQPSQTWFKPGAAWVNYLRNCQRLLQQGNPVTDIAVFTGEEVPRRAVLPDRLLPVFPGIFGNEVIEREKIRLENKGVPMHEQPKGVKVAQNITSTADWIDPLSGYAYDSFNKDALLNLATVKDGKVVLPGGASYSLFVVPGTRQMNPEAKTMSLDVAKKLLEMIKAGATVYIEKKPKKTFNPSEKKEFETVVDEMFAGDFESLDNGNIRMKSLGKGRLITGVYKATSFKNIGINKDFLALNENGYQTKKLAWTHRCADGKEIYFISNQQAQKRQLSLSFRVAGKKPELYFPVSGKTLSCKSWKIENGRTVIPLELDCNESVFVLFEKATSEKKMETGKNKPLLKNALQLKGTWEVEFNKNFKGPDKPVVFKHLTNWSSNQDKKIKYYSGTAVYRKSFEWQENTSAVWLDLGKVYNLAEVKVNGINCGVSWTNPYRIDISKALKEGTNKLEIAVTNTWANRLIGDHRLPENEKLTWTTCAYRLEGQDLLPAGLLGPVAVKIQR